jgi:sugar transferase (PEP-CTERM/EpsH1 system associated)
VSLGNPTVKILFVVPYVPNLIRVRPYNLLVHLAARGHNITLVTLYSSEKEQADLERLSGICEAVYAFPLTRWRSYYNSLTALPQSIPLQSVYCWQPEMARCLIDLTHSDNGFDVIHIEHLRGAKYGLELKKIGKPAIQGGRQGMPPIVWDSVDCISMLFKQAAGQSKKRLNRWVTRFEFSRTGRYEGWLVNQFDRVLVTSKNDRDALMKLAPANTADCQIRVLPNGVDLNYFQPPKETAEKDPATLVISGKMSYHANVTMSLNFVNDTLPIIWSRRPDVKLVLVGKDPTPELLNLRKNPAIRVTGTVDDIRPYLHQATLAVTPITYGAGIQNKVLEAMACGLPVVSSPQAVSALSVTPGHDLVVANNPEEFADAVVRLLDDPGLRSRLGQAGRQYVEQDHLWVRIAAQLEEVYNEVIHP